MVKGSAEAAEYLAPITDPASDIDDEEWEKRRKQEHEKELIRQRERELQQVGTILNYIRTQRTVKLRNHTDLYTVTENQVDYLYIYTVLENCKK